MDVEPKNKDLPQSTQKISTPKNKLPKNKDYLLFLHMIINLT